VIFKLVETIVIEKEYVITEHVNVIKDFLVNFARTKNVPTNAMKMELVLKENVFAILDIQELIAANSIS